MKFCPELTVYSLLIYPSHSYTNAAKEARQFVRIRIKQDQSTQTGQGEIKIIDRTIEKLRDDLEEFSRKWGSDAIAVPVPGHAPIVDDGVWSSLTTAYALRQNGFVSDVVTRGSTLIGMATLILDAYPNCRIQAFTIARTVTNHDLKSTKEMTSPKEEMITFDGTTLRRE